MIILCDFDDVINDLTQKWVIRLNKKFNKNVAFEDVHEYDISKAFPDVDYDKLFDPLRSMRFWKTVKPNEGAISTVNELINRGHKIYFCTASHPDSNYFKYQTFIKKYFPFFSYKYIIVAHNKKMVRGDILIDDNPGNFGGQKYSILVDKPWNQEASAERRAYSWNQILKFVEEIEREKEKEA